MTSSEPGDEQTITYAIRLSIQAQQDAVEAAVFLANVTEDPALATVWFDGLYEHIAGLAENPQRCVVSESATRRFRMPIRQHTYRRTPHATPYYVYFNTVDESDDGPTLTVVHIRHSSRRPITPSEARQILGNQ